MNCRSPRLWSAVFPTLLTTLLATSPLTLGSSSPRASAATLPVTGGFTEVKGTVPPLVNLSTAAGLTDPSTRLTFAFILPFRNRAALNSELADIYNPKSPKYGQYLSREEFAAKYAPSAEDFAAVEQYAAAQGFTITKLMPSRKMITVTAPASLVASAFGIQFGNFTAPGGRTFFAPLASPKLPIELASKIEGISGLSNAAVFHNHLGKKAAADVTLDAAKARLGIGALYNTSESAAPAMGNRAIVPDLPEVIGSDPVNHGLTPTDIYTAYSFKPYTSTTPATSTGFGKGQTLGLFELDVETPQDIVLYEQKFGLPLLNPMIETDPTNPVTPTGGEDEVDLDIELQLAMAPLATNILVYEGGNLNSLVVQQYQTIADADAAQEISTSWGAPEVGQDNGSLHGELDAFEQMAAQGQSIFAASGDNGAMDGGGTSATVNMTDATALLVDDPSSDPFMTATGGTTLSVVTPETNLNYKSEASWGTPDTGDGGGGGGGISRIWTILPNGTDQPGVSYQAGGIVPNPAAIPSGYPTADTDATYPTNPDPKVYRNTPDLSINANPDTGYSIEFDNGAGEAEIVGGTSAAAPLWSAIVARINEQRALNGLPNIGFFNPMLYRVGHDGYTGITYRYPTTMHDPQDNSTNLYFPAVKGFDDSTGWGTPVGGQVIIEYGSPTPTNFGVSQGDTTNHVHWDAMPKATQYDVYKALNAQMTNATKILVTSNSFVDRNLTNGTQYFYEVQARYSGGYSNRAGTSNGTPQVVKIRTTATPTVGGNHTSFTVGWLTNSESNSKVIYGTTAGSLTGTVSSTSLVRTHSLTITGLTPGVTYYYQFSSTDEQNKVATSKVLSITLPTS